MNKTDESLERVTHTHIHTYIHTDILKNKKAITLIALVITIVVLIILASVAITLSLGNNGIFNRAKYAKKEYLNSKDYEETELAKATNDIDTQVNSNRGTVNIDEKTWNDFLNDYNKLKNSQEYHAGDTITFASEVITSGYITGASKYLRFSIFLDKSIGSDVKKINYSTVGYSVRTVGGSYIINSSDNYTDDISKHFEVQCFKSNVITLLNINESAYSATNNTPISICLRNLTVSFE